MSPESDRTLREFWARRVSDALNEYRRCSEATSQFHRFGIVALPQKLKVLEQEQMALANYARLLRVYTHLVVYGNEPTEPYPQFPADATKCPECGTQTQLYAFRLPVCLQCDAQSLEERRKRIRMGKPALSEAGILRATRS